MTNFEKIKAMTIDEMSEMIAMIVISAGCCICSHEGDCRDNKTCNLHNSDYWKTWKDWLECEV